MVNLYCERVSAGLWGEPLNTVSNVAFFLAAWASWILAKQRKSDSREIFVLVISIIVIGICSSIFHAFATTWGRVLDALSILVFQLAYLWLYSRRLIKLNIGIIVTMLVAYIFAAVIGRQFPDVLNGSLIYAPAFILIIGLGFYHYLSNKEARFSLLSGAGTFLGALYFRTIDNSICSIWPYGTHFLWHILVAITIYLTMRGLLFNRPQSVKTL